MKKILIVVDYQNDFVSGSLGFEQAKSLEPAIVQKIKEYRSGGHTVAFTYDTHSQDYLSTQEGSLLPIPHCIRGTQGWQLYGAVAQLLQPGDPVFYKETFGSLDLAQFLHKNQFVKVELVGLVSNICVLSNAVLAKAALPQAQIVVDAACTLAADRSIHEKALDVLAGVQVTVLNR